MRERSPAARPESESVTHAGAQAAAVPAAAVESAHAAVAAAGNRALATIYRQEQPGAGGRIGLWGRDPTTRRLYLSLLAPARSLQEIASYVYGDAAQAAALRAANAGLSDPVSPGTSVQLVDGTLSPTAKAEVERDAAGGIMLRGSGVAGAGAHGTPVYRASLGGADVELTEPQMAGLLAGMARKFGLDAEKLRGTAEIVRDVRNDHEENSATWVRWTSDTLGGVDLPDADFADRAIEAMTAAKAAFDAVASAPVSGAQAYLARGLALLQEGAPLVDEAERTWKTYIKGTIEGAGAAESGLTLIRNASFAVAAGLAGAIAAPAVFAAATAVVGTGAVGTTVSAGAGLVAAAGAGGATKGVLETAGATGGELLSMTAPGDQQFDLGYVGQRAVEGVKSGAIEGLYGGAGSFVSAGLAARMPPELLATLGGRIALGAATGGIVGLGGAGVNVAAGGSDLPWWQELLFGAGQGALVGALFSAMPVKGLYRVDGQPYTPAWMSASPFAPRSPGQGPVQVEFRIVSENPTTGEITAIGRSPATGETAVMRLDPATGTGSATMTEGPRAGVTVPIANGRLQPPPTGLLPPGQGEVVASPVPAQGQLPPGSRPQAPPWDQLIRQAERPVARQQTGGFRSQSARTGEYEVIILEGPIGEQIAQTESLARYTDTLPGEHATHGVGMQGGENLPEGITSAPQRLNLSGLKRMENAIRTVADRAAEQGATVETTTTLLVQHRLVGGQDIPILVGVTRQAWVRPPGSDEGFQFVDFEARIDPVTREVTPVREEIIRARR